tara:strand:+ start:233 stop:532 length:300 start_codon:yes stop_codon:yes gene_type:complete
MKVLKVFSKLVTLIEHEEVNTKIKGTDYISKPAKRAKRGVFRLYDSSGNIVDPRLAKIGNKKMFEPGKEPRIELRFTDIKCIDLKTGKDCTNLYEMEAV